MGIIEEEYEPATVDARATVMGKSNAIMSALETIGNHVKVEVTQVHVRTHTLVVPIWYWVLARWLPFGELDKLPIEPVIVTRVPEKAAA